MNKELFVKEVEKLGVFLTKEQLQKLDEFYKILISENNKINLTRIVDEEEVYLKHFYDSITLIKVVDLKKENLKLCDVGTGAGFPGVVLKIVFPNLKITLVDALQKRVLYLQRVIEKLELKDIETIHIRSEEYARKTREVFDIVTARAVANLKVLSEITIPLVKVDGYFVAMKANVDEEIKESKQRIKELKSEVTRIEKFLLPFENSIRNLVVIKKNDKTPNKYPRNINKIKEQKRK